MRGLSEFLVEHVVVPLNDMGVPIDLRGIQAILILLPALALATAFIRAWLTKRRQMKDAGM